MNCSRVARVAFVAASLASLIGCADDQTLVSVNVSSTDEVGNPSSIVITIAQQGEPPVVKEVMPPTQTQDGGVTIQPKFFERIVLPDSWERGPGEVKVEAKDARGVYLTAKTEITVRPGGAVAAFVDLGKKPEMMNPDQDDAGAADGGS
jgi:hypothetical protein